MTGTKISGNSNKYLAVDGIVASDNFKLGKFN